MGTRDPRVDAYIAKSAPFAQEILTYLRELVHETVPDVQENIKWSFPHFDYKGIFCSMAAFKQHCSFGFWLHHEVMGEDAADEGMGAVGKVTSLKELPSRTKLKGYLKKAKQLQDAGVKRGANAPAKPKSAPKPVVVPSELRAALSRNAEAKAHFAKMSPSHQREYCEWIAEAKKPETKERRVLKAVEQIAEGKSQNWKYESKK
jgi:uncharacterized protein YdeI (YjbR/CyaY-like superfamily)